MAREAARVLKPGGVFILADSIQLGDRPRVDAHLGRFSDFNEPYYRSGSARTPWSCSASGARA